MASRKTDTDPLYHTIVLPERPQLIHIMALMLVQKFGENLIPGVANADVAVLTQFDAGFSARPAQELERGGYLLLTGAPGSRFNPSTHASTVHGRDNILMLIAKEVGVHDELWFERVAELVMREAAAPSGLPLGLPHQLASFLTQNPGRELEAVEWAARGLALLLNEQIARWRTCREEFAAKILSGRARVETIERCWTGYPIKIAGIMSSDEEMLCYLYRPEGLGADVAMIERPYRQVEILAAKKGLNLNRVARFIRAAEMQAKSIALPEDFTALETPGVFPGAAEWNYRDRRKLCCGSRWSPGDNRTRIPFHRLFELIKFGYAR